MGIKVLLAQGLELHCALLEGQTLFVCILGHLGCHVVANDWVEARDKHQTGTGITSASYQLADGRLTSREGER